MTADCDNGLLRRARPLLGTIVEIAVDAQNGSSIDDGFEAAARIHGFMSFHEPGSDLSRLKRAMSGNIVALSPETMTVLETARALHRSTAGIFDVSIGRLMVTNGYLPRDHLIHRSRFKGGMEDIEFLDNCRVRLKRRVLIELGGIAKGFAVDQAVVALVNAGAQYGIVNAGGDLRIFGNASQPIMLRRGNGALIDLGEMTNCAIASSENVHSRHRARGKLAAPHMGADGHCVFIDDLIAISASTCMIADAMTKVAMVDVALADRLLAAHDGRVLYAPAPQEPS